MNFKADCYSAYFYRKLKQDLPQYVSTAGGIAVFMTKSPPSRMSERTGFIYACCGMVNILVWDIS